jgi:hypothetical protein
MLRPGAAKTRKYVCRNVVAAHLGQRTDWTAHGFIGDLHKAVGQFIRRFSCQTLGGCQMVVGDTQVLARERLECIHTTPAVAINGATSASPTCLEKH